MLWFLFYVFERSVVLRHELQRLSEVLIGALVRLSCNCSHSGVSSWWLGACHDTRHRSLAPLVQVTLFLRWGSIAWWVCIRWTCIVFVLYRPELGSNAKMVCWIVCLVPTVVLNLVRVRIDLFKSWTSGLKLLSWIIEDFVHNFIGSFLWHFLHSFKSLCFTCFFCLWSHLTDNFFNEIRISLLRSSCKT